MMAHVGAGSLLPAPFCLGLGLLLACGAPDQRAAVSPLTKLSPALRALVQDSQSQHLAHRVIVDLTEQVDQVREYRNWVAHGKRKAVKNAVTPEMAYDRLKRFLDHLLTR